MTEKLTLEIVTPEKIVLHDNDIDFVGVKYLEGDGLKQGEIGIMTRHAPMLVRLPIAPVRYRKKDNHYYVVVAGGFLEVSNNKVTILSAGAEVVIKEPPDMDLALIAKKRVESW
ncbi:MAG: F0F1 ATP synthase subunit epsilon, partial [bacterium]